MVFSRLCRSFKWNEGILLNWSVPVGEEGATEGERLDLMKKRISQYRAQKEWIAVSWMKLMYNFSPSFTNYYMSGYDDLHATNYRQVLGIQTYLQNSLNQQGLDSTHSQCTQTSCSSLEPALDHSCRTPLNPLLC